MAEAYHYADVPGILDALQAEGAALSAGRVRERRGGIGSYQYIQEDIRTWQCANGLPPADEPQALQLSPVADYSPPVPDPEAVQRHLDRLRTETHIGMAADHLLTLLATLRVLPHPLQAAEQELRRRHAVSQRGLSFAQLTSAPHRPAAERLMKQLPALEKDLVTLLRAIEGLTSEGEPHDRQPQPAA
jgi:hypothetical protein